MTERRGSLLLLGAELAAAVVERAPEIPTGDAGVRCPFRTDFEHVFRRDLSLSVSALDRVLDSEIDVGEHVRAAELEHEEHLRGPATDALHLHEMLDELRILERLDVMQRKGLAMNAL